MTLLINLFVMMLLAGLNAPSYAVVSGGDPGSCAVFNDESSNGDDKKEGDKKEDGKEEEEPDCE